MQPSRSEFAGVDNDPDLPWPLDLRENEVLDRFAWARKRGLPQYLWPDVPRARWRRALRTIQSTLQGILGPGRPVLEARDESEVRALGVAGYTSGLGPLLGYWIEQGMLLADPLSGRLFAHHLAHGRARSKNLAMRLERVVDAFARDEIQPLLVKAGHSAVEYFPEPGTRPAIDLDLVVHPKLFELAEKRLRQAGYVLGAREYGPRKSTWLAPGAARLPRSLEVFHAESQYAVDLHDSLSRNFFGIRSASPARLEDLERKVPWGPDGRIRVLGHPELLMYHALHASEGLYNLTLVRILELVFMIRQDTANRSLDWSEFRRLMTDRSLGRFVYPALTLAERLAPGIIDEEALDQAEADATPQMRRILGGLQPAEAQRLGPILLQEKFMWCATPADHIRRVTHMLVPAPSGRSLRWLARNYQERMYRILRRTVSFKNP